MQIESLCLAAALLRNVTAATIEYNCFCKGQMTARHGTWDKCVYHRWAYSPNKRVQNYVLNTQRNLSWRSKGQVQVHTDTMSNAAIRCASSRIRRHEPTMVDINCNIGNKYKIFRSKLKVSVI